MNPREPKVPAPILFEIHARAWLRELSDQAGVRVTLADVPHSEIQKWKSLGFTHVWLMGMWQIGPLARQAALRHWREGWRTEIPSVESDVHGSPYAIEQYAVDARLGDPLSLLLFRERLAQAGLKLILDFVPNHYGLDSPEPKRHPARFVQSPKAVPGTFPLDTAFGRRFFAHGRDPFFQPWRDTIQLDYRVAETHQAMASVAQTLAMYGHGLRCDMAMLLLPEIFRETWKQFPSVGAHQTDANFWSFCLPRIRQSQPEAELIAEVYWDREEALQESGFDYTYNKTVYDCIARRQYAELRNFLSHRPLKFFERGVHFLENHDEPRAAAIFSERRHKAAAALILFLPGMALLHDGQLEGRRISARIQMERRAPEPSDPAISRFYHKLLAAIQRSSIRKGKPAIARSTPEGLFVIAWKAAGDQIDLGIVNLDDNARELLIPWTELGHAPRSLSILWTSDPAIGLQVDSMVTMPPESACIARALPR